MESATDNLPAVPIANPPRKHHYLPEFYLRRWAGDDGKLERYSMEHGERVHRRRVHPSQAAFAIDLNRIPGEHEDEWQAQRIETELFAPLDNAAAVVADQMISSMLPPETSEGRTVWATFVLSMLHRSPSNFAATLRKVRELNEELMPEAEERYAELRGPNDPPTFAEWENQRAENAVEVSGRRAMMDAIASPRSGPAIINLHWQVLDLGAAPMSLVTSDNPVILVPIHTDDGHIAMALSPTKLFLATRQRRLRDGVRRAPPQLIVRTANRLLVERADRHVIALSDAHDTFVRRYIGTCRVGSLATGFSQPSRQRRAS